MSALAMLAASGCSINWIHTGLVSGLGSTEILAIDVASDTAIGSVVLPGTVLAYQSLPVAVWPLATVGVVGQDFDLHVLNIDTTSVTTAAGSPIVLTGRAGTVATGWQSPWVVTGGLAAVPGVSVSVVDLGSMAEVSALGMPGARVDALALCDDNQSILVATIGPNEVKRLAVTAQGMLSDPGETTLGVPASTVGSLDCAPGSQVGAMVTNAGAEIVSFTITVGTGLQEVDRLDSAAMRSGKPGAAGNEATFARDGTGLFVRSSNILGNQQEGWVERYEIDSASGQMTPTPVFTSPAGVSGNASGLSRIGVHPQGDRIYVPEEAEGRIAVRDAANGNFIQAITYAGVANPFVTHVSGPP